MLDIYKLKNIFKEPFYAGVIRMSNWDVVRHNGLHKAMITEAEHERLLEIVLGKGKKFTVHKYNPLFPASNIIECADCVAEGAEKARLVGYRHHNNKPERTRRFYERYRCRSCGKNITKDKLHKGISRVLNRTELSIDDKGEFLDSMRKVWHAEVSNSLEAVTRLKQKHTLLTQEKDNLVRTMAGNPDLADDFKGSIVAIKAEIVGVETEIGEASNIEEDFEQFMAFALDYTEHFRENWWTAEDADDRIRLKQLLYKDGLTVSRAGKVLTPTLSPIYRYRTSNKKYQNTISGSFILTGGPGGT